ncbi:UvrD-helicase domain-containing protein [Halomonas sp. I5-271120]|uniref:UvrD-helicase domain-containing protein n=1 Tax=Halomonas sp. I5-271120 TaxID=3061632 RepID=UPI0027145333|nr:UvrD-helicase domain-containing protein [Halomonas sp. I5-271120]
MKPQWSPSPWARRVGASRAWQLSLDETHASLTRGDERQTIPLWQVHAIERQGGLLWPSCLITRQSEDCEIERIRLAGLSRGEGRRLRKTLHKMVINSMRADFRDISVKLGQDWNLRVPIEVQQRANDGWVTQSMAAELRASRDDVRQPETGLTAFAAYHHPMFQEAADGLPLKGLHDAYSPMLEDEVQRANHGVTQKALARHHDYFVGVEARPLTQEQAEAAVCFDDRVRVIAAAGSGKTSTMVARAGYAVRAGYARPNQILLLAFNRDAASELKHRVKRQLPGWIEGSDQIAVNTFHSFGLAVIGKATGRKPTVPGWLDNGKDLEVIEDIMRELIETESTFRIQWSEYSALLGEDPGASEAADDGSASEASIVTLRGEHVKSQEEKAIADWLLYHGIDYCYERPYPRDTADAEHSQYHPDFYYPDIDLYHEHLALDANGQPPPHFEGYADGVDWKRQLHRQDGNRYFETTSHGLRTGQSLAMLDAELRRHGLTPTPSLGNLGDRVKPVTVSAFARLVRPFMQHYKGTSLRMEDLIEMGKDILEGGRHSYHYTRRVRLFISLFTFIVDAWDRRLTEQGAVDYDDMLNQAADLIERGEWVSPYRAVMVDEWQDTSIARARIAKALNQQGASLFTVGDDWQAVARFAGSDVRFMTDFEARLGSCTTRYLTQTFRCPQALNDMASAFVSANPEQIKKQVSSHNPLEGRSIRYVPHGRGEMAAKLTEQLRRLAIQAEEQGERYSVFLLGRYKRDAPEGLAEITRAVSPLVRVRFATAHESKGLEADYVFLLNVHGGPPRGFPSTIEDDSLLELVMPEREVFPHAEERRLFYVALTRAKRRVLLLSESERVSPFLDELVDLGLPPLTDEAGAPIERCSRCRVGVLQQRQGPYGDFITCGGWKCDFKQKGNLSASARF